ncbi:NAD(P)H-dependent oxidoreductase [Halococcus salifodinae]|uniref:SAF domain-containing protein n=1 Tax=Halococcus salifodinae DSM 8989 TaxID=1227456 RepID=M0NCD5_9EURY|nr:SAF domain-containing protein [Halococcus salifodinae]EMA54764.1 SAF domain-containing protein [Halococcus salifodinae DSM 8989]
MLNTSRKLADRESPVRVGVIGAGLFGSNTVAQIERVPGMRTAAIADVNAEKAAETYRAAGVDERTVVTAQTPRDANEAITADERTILDDGLDLVQMDLDVVVEATGIPNLGARHAYDAIVNDTHVVMATVEADSVVGPILTELAEQCGVVYSMAYGDQPALIVELCDWAESVGLDIVAAGKGNAYLEEYRHGTPDDVFDRLDLDEAFVDSHDLNARMYNSFLDGTKVAVEMCAVANATGLRPDRTGMHLPTAEIPEIPNLLRPKSDGGLLDDMGVVETVSSLHPDGSSVTRDISFGVFVVTTTPTERTRAYLEENAGTGFYVSDDGDYQVFYRPYHLPGAETTISIANAVLYDEPTGASYHRVGEVVARAKQPLEPGEDLDGGGGYTIYGVLEDATTVDESGHIPFELLDGATVTEPVDRDAILTYDDVDVETDSFIYHLRRLQDDR